MQTLALAPADERLAFHGHIGLEHSPSGTIARRLTPHAKELFPSELEVNLWQLSAYAAGVRIAFETDSTYIGGHCAPAKWLAPIDIVSDGEMVGAMEIDEAGAFAFDGLAAGNKSIELWLPHRGSFQLRDLQFSAGATVKPLADNRPKWLTYGSSITHATEAHSPMRTWPAVVARQRDLNLTCLGFAGNCHLEPMLARLIRDRDADAISICAGINAIGGSLTPRTFRSSVIGFVQIVREKHPDTPIALISPIWSAPRETRIANSPWSLPALRREVRAAVDALQKHGDSRTFYVDGLDIVGPNEAYILPDDLHPDGDGQSVVAARFDAAVGARLFADNEV